MPLSDVVVAGDRLPALRAVRDDLARRLEQCTSDQNYSTMARVLVDVMAQIEALEKSEPGREATALDELEAKRRRRSAGSADASRRAHPSRKVD